MVNAAEPGRPAAPRPQPRGSAAPSRPEPPPWLLTGPRTRPEPGGRTTTPRAVLFDRDGTLVEDVPYNGDPARVRPMPHARAALARLRTAGVGLGVVSNQSGVARGLLTRQQVEAVRDRIEELLGPFDVWAICPHGPADRCGCRKPAPGLVLAAARGLGVEPRRTTVIGDIGADCAAARAAGARGILVPTAATRTAEVAREPEVAADLAEAVELALSGADPGCPVAPRGGGPGR
ncbi:haloacid dehalogenase [Wenjunlia vitaminophila]|uniref:D,D-heptose 1,7-bisphosphate phosphatase n=1 Tax=Wenjunlia vitaminophila TaxID=76728 RepID=A0A0T6LW59_WENVI|nr:haloacid dehalogenase [Wenjunlia vitaminophila]